MTGVDASRIGGDRLAWARGMAGRSLTDQAEILRKVIVQDAAGGQTETESVVATVPARLATQRAVGVIGTEPVEAGRVVAVTPWRCYVPAGTDVRPTDALMVNGTRYEVVEADQARTDSVVVAVSLRRIS